jgi:hypothetical protein
MALRRRKLMLRSLRKSWLVVTLLVGIISCTGALASSLGAQTPDASMPGVRQQQEQEDPFTLQQKKEMAKKRNEQRQQELKKDTDKLLELATELKQYVDKTNENIISLDVIKKAEQIEKLAHAVKEKMKGQ